MDVKGWKAGQRPLEEIASKRLVSSKPFAEGYAAWERGEHKAICPHSDKNSYRSQLARQYWFNGYNYAKDIGLEHASPMARVASQEYAEALHALEVMEQLLEEENHGR